MSGDLVSEKPVHQSTEDTNVKQSDQIRRKRRRYLEALSITCSVVGVNIVIACFCGMTDDFGFKSPEMIFKCAFAFLFASVILGVLAMISSVRKYECLQISTSDYSLLYRLFRVYSNSRNKYTENTKKVTSTVNPEPEKLQSACVKTPNANEKCQVTRKCPDALLRVQPREGRFSVISPGQSSDLLELKKRQYEGKPRVQPTFDELSNVTGQSTAPLVWKHGQYEDKPSIQPTVDGFSNVIPGQSAVLLQWNNRQYEDNPRVQTTVNGFSSVTPGQISGFSQWKKKEYYDKPLLRLKKGQTEFLSGQCMTTQVSFQYLKSSRLVLYNMEESNERSSLVPMIQESFIAEFDINKQSKPLLMKQRDMFTRRPHLGSHPHLVSHPYNVRNTNFEVGCNYNFPKRFTPIETSQKQPKDQVSDVISKLNEMNFLS